MSLALFQPLHHGGSHVSAEGGLGPDVLLAVLLAVGLFLAALGLYARYEPRLFRSGRAADE